LNDGDVFGDLDNIRDVNDVLDVFGLPPSSTYPIKEASAVKHPMIYSLANSAADAGIDYFLTDGIKIMMADGTINQFEKWTSDKLTNNFLNTFLIAQIVDKITEGIVHDIVFLGGEAHPEKARGLFYKFTRPVVVRALESFLSEEAALKGLHDRVLNEGGLLVLNEGKGVAPLLESPGLLERFKIVGQVLHDNLTKFLFQQIHKGLDRYCTSH